MLKKQFKAACLQIKAMDVVNYTEAERQILDMIAEACEKGAELIILPECAYPSYYIGNDRKAFTRSMGHLPEVIGAISEQALKQGVYIASGFLAMENDRLYNLGILWGPDGKEIGRVRKSNMWHFDSKYVGYGKEYEVFDTAIGKIGMIICADGRAPEISRILALKGAEILIDMANLVTSGKDPAKLSNPQVEYMLPARAKENGLWILMADKVGIEAGTVLNTGLSCIIDPYGTILHKASSDKPEILMGDIELGDNKPSITSRKPELYGSIIVPTDELPVSSTVSENISAGNRDIFCSVARFLYSSASEYMERAEYFTSMLEDQGSSLIMLPALTENIPISEVQSRLQKVLLSPEVLVVLSGYTANEEGNRRTAVAFTSEGTRGCFYSNHGRSFPVSYPLVPIKTHLGNVAVMFDEEGHIPEVARCFMLEGTDILLWSDIENDPLSEIMARTRASENRIFVIRSENDPSEGYGCIIAPSGQIVAATIPGMDHAVSSLLLKAAARSKTVVPGTDVVKGRRPELYHDLLR